MLRFIKCYNTRSRIYQITNFKISEINQISVIRINELEQNKVSVKLVTGSFYEGDKFTIEKDSEFFELKQKIMENNIDKEMNIMFLDYDNKEISLNNKLNDIGFNFRMILLGKNIYREVFLQDISESKRQLQDQYKHYEEFCKEINVPIQQQNLILNYIRKVDNIFEKKYSFKPFDQFQKNSITTLEKEKVYKVMLEALISKSDKNLHSDLLQSYIFYLNQIKDKEKQYEEIVTQAERRIALRKGVGLLALMSQLLGVGYGTYIQYSWDVVEPIAYFVNYSATILFAAYYFKLNTSFSPQNYFAYLKNNQIQKIALSKGFDLNLYLSQKTLLNQLQSQIKINTLNSLI